MPLSGATMDGARAHAGALPGARDQLRGLRESVYVASVWMSAFLLFLLQPMLARLLLPVYGGSPAVWNTCMVFFQMLLLAGYAWAHGSLRRLGPARQAVVHGALLAASLLFLPRALHAAAVGAGRPVPSILLALALVAGVPFLALSTNSSLTQRWFSLGAFRGSADPFWLYAASNAGSLAALLGYPLLVEPALGLRAQLRYWSVAYTAWLALSAASILITWCGLRAAPTAAAEPAAAPATDGRAVTPRRRLGWTLRSAVASSLLLSVTMQLTTEVVSAPLVWVLPLAIYLVTFVVAFSPSLRPRRHVVAYLTMVGIALCFVLVIIPTMFPVRFALVALLGTLFVGALLCHGDLADDRPGARELTDFYLWITVGGVVGGVLNSPVAPVLFGSVVEYPVTLGCLALLLPGGAADSSGAARRRLRGLAAYPPAWAMVAATLLAAAFVLAGRAHPVGATTAAGAAGAGLLRWQFMPVAVLVCGVLLVVDAFTSDAIPTHLLTEEAFAVYLRTLKPRGVLVMHISNRYADLRRVFRGWSRATGRPVAIDEYVPPPAAAAHGVKTTVAVALARSDTALVRGLDGPRWRWLDTDGPAVHWTDDHIDLLSVLDGRMLER